MERFLEQYEAGNFSTLEVVHIIIRHTNEQNVEKIVGIIKEHHGLVE